MLYQRIVHDVQAWKWDGDFNLQNLPEWIQPPKRVTERTVMFNACESNTIVVGIFAESGTKELHLVEHKGKVIKIHKNDYIVRYENGRLAVYNSKAFSYSYKLKEQQ